VGKEESGNKIRKLETKIPASGFSFGRPATKFQRPENIFRKLATKVPAFGIAFGDPENVFRKVEIKFLKKKNPFDGSRTRIDEHRASSALYRTGSDAYLIWFLLYRTKIGSYLIPLGKRGTKKGKRRTKIGSYLIGLGKRGTELGSYLFSSD